MNIQHLPLKVTSINSAVVSRCSINSLEERFNRKADPVCKVEINKTGMTAIVLLKSKDAALVYVEKGELVVLHNSKKYTLNEGTLLVKAPDIIFELGRCSDDCSFKVVAFTPLFSAASGIGINHLETIALTASNNPVLVLDTLKSATVNALFALLHEKESASEKEELFDESMKHVFSLLILEIISLIRKNLSDSTSALNRKAHLTFQFMKLLRAHVKEQRSVNFYADMLYVTPKHLSMCVKETTGKTCGEIIDETVVTEAKTLLHNPELTIGRVADELNFSDQYFFSKYFKKRTGMSPMNYRMAV